MSPTDECPFITFPDSPEGARMIQMPPEDEKLRQFFLEEARRLCPATNTDCTEYSKLHTLSRRLKRMERLFTLFYTHGWGEIYQDVQRAFSFYMLEGFIPKKERVRLIDLLAKEISFITQAAQYNDFITFLMQYYSSQVADIDRLINNYYRPETVNPFPEQDD